MKAGTGEISEKEKAIQAEEERKRLESKGRYNQYLDYIDDADELEANQSEEEKEKLKNLEYLDKRLESKSQFKGVNNNKTSNVGASKEFSELYFDSLSHLILISYFLFR